MAKRESSPVEWGVAKWYPEYLGVMSLLWNVVRLLLVLVCIPLAALLGGILTKEGKPLGRFVARYFRWVCGTIWLSVVIAQVVDRRLDSSLTGSLRLVAWGLCAAMFMPTLRHLERSGDK